MPAQGGRARPLSERLQIIVVAIVCAFSAGAIAAASADRKPFGIVDEPLYAPGAIAMAASLSGAGPAHLDTSLSSHPPFGSLLLGLGLLGQAVLGTLCAALLVHVRLREVLLPLVLYPLLAPVVIAGVQVTALSQQHADWDAIGGWLLLLAAFDVVALVLAPWLHGKASTG